MLWTIQSYFAINDAQDIIAVKQNRDVVADRFMSYGTFHTFIKPTQRYGITFGGRMTGMQMDIDRLLRSAVAKDNDLTKLANFNQSQGARQSANEHLVPEQMFDNPDTEEKEVEGVSAVKAIQIAQQQGQKIFTITQDNYNETISQISLSSGAMEDIRNAINAGKTVTTHQSNISYKGWNGSGYIIQDPTTGTGAYLIDGGANGAFVLGIFAGLLVLIFGVPALIALAGILIGFLYSIHKAGEIRNITLYRCFLNGFLTPFTIHPLRQQIRNILKLKNNKISEDNALMEAIFILSGLKSLYDGVKECSN